MRRVVSSLLLLASAALFMGGAGVIVAILAAKQAALWLGGWGILLISQPVVTIGLLCLVFGLAMRWLSSEDGKAPEEPAKLQYRLAAYGLIGLGILAIADHTVRALVFAMLAEVDLGIFAFLPVLGPKIPIGLASMMLGLLVLRRAPRVSSDEAFATSAIFRNA